MSSTRQLKSRIRSVGNTKQITRAMQMVAASKMRRAQDATKASRPYAVSAGELLTHLASQGATDSHPLFAKRPVRSRLLVLIAGDKGLAGAYNSNIIKTYINELRSDEAGHVKNYTITIGRKASQFVSRLKNIETIGAYNDLPDQPEGGVFRAILDTAKTMFIAGDIDAVDIVYTDFISSVSQQSIVQRILPAGFSPMKVSQFVKDARYEPDVSTILDGVAYRLIGTQLYQALLDARASEHSMRMMAMKNATDNASDLVEDLTLEMNKARQSAITQELAEISGGVEAMSS